MRCLGVVASSVALSLAWSCATQPPSRYLPYPVAGMHPAMGTEARVNQGEVIYAEFDYVAQTRMRLLEEVVIDKTVLQARSMLVPRRNTKQGEQFCQDVEMQDSEGKVKSVWGCLTLAPKGGQIVSTRAGFADRQGRDYGPPKSPVRFELVEEPITTGGAFRHEIIFAGAAAGVLRLLYREYQADFIRAAFSQELTYEYQPGQRMTISVKDARIDIREAGNNGIDYVVLSGFTQ